MSEEGIRRTTEEIRAETDRIRAQIDAERLLIDAQKLELEKQRVVIEESKLKFEHSKALVDVQKASFDATMKFADISVKSLLILNGGAAISVISFAASRAKESIPINGEILSDIIFYFGLGAMISSITAGLSYLAQAAFTYATKFKKILKYGRTLQFLAVACAVGSIIAFGNGMLTASKEVKPPKSNISKATQG